ncbi:MAG: BatA domain-containing protein, partial [Marinirhabdus sp.]
MQFKHPELLYALFLLLIPVLIHLFQLRKFQKVAFTNVAFLKKATVKARKSSRVKKWLTLFLRVLALACTIIAFAQPFTASKIAMNTQKETVIYIDNSFSMQAKGANGPLLNDALQQLYGWAPGDEKLSYFTNSETKEDVGAATFKAEVLNTPYSQYQRTPKEVLLQAEKLFSKSPLAYKKLVYISDFQGVENFPELPPTVAASVVKLKPVHRRNISIDTAFVRSKTPDNTTITV